MSAVEKMPSKQFNPLYKHMLTDVIMTGGATYNILGRAERKGFAVAGFGPERLLECAGLHEQDLLWFETMVRKYVEVNVDKLATKDYYLGLWHTNGTLHMDIVRIFMNAQEANDAGNSNDQRYYYDLANRILKEVM